MAVGETLKTNTAVLIAVTLGKEREEGGDREKGDTWSSTPYRLIQKERAFILVW